MSETTIEEYEFMPSENQVIDRFATAMKMFSLFLIVAGILTMFQFFPDFTPMALISGISWAALGLAFYFPTDNFQKVVETEGSDVAELMTGFKELKTGWLIAIIILVINRLATVLDLMDVL